MAERHSRTTGKKIPVSQRLNFYARKKKSESDASHGNLEVKAQKHPENLATSGQPFLDPNEGFSAVLEYLIENNFINFKFTKYKCKIQNRGESNLVFICDKEDKKTVSLAKIMYKNTNDKINFKNLSENDGSGFQLGKYFEFFRDLEDHVYFHDEVEYSEIGELFVCSNVDFEDDLKCFSKVCINNESDDEKFYKLNLKDSGSKKLLFPTEYITEQEKLAKELVYCIMFDNNTYLMNENLYKFMKKYQIFLVEEVFNSLNNGFSDLFLSENLKLLNLNIFKFRQIFIKELDIFFSNFKDITSLETQTDIKFRSKEKALESIKKQIDLYKEINILDFLRNLSFNFANYFPVNDDDKIKIFPPANIDISQVDVKIDRFLSSLTFVIKTKMKIDTKEFINSNLRRFLKHELNNIMEGKWIGKESLMDKVLDKPISFKGQNIILKQIINFQTLNNPDILSEILFKEFPSHIGKEISIKKDMAYIPRKLKNSMSVHKDILKLNKIDMFVIFIKEIDVEYFQRKFTDKDEGFVNIVLGFNKSIRLYYVIGNYNLGFLPFIKSECNVLISNDNELNFITETNIHFLTYENDNLKWNHTVGDFDRIRIYFFDFEDEFYLSELDCVDGPRFIIINGRFGLGKSTLLDNVTRTLTDQKLNKESIWVCNIDLGKYENHLTIKFTRDKTGLSDAYEYIYQCENIDNDFSKFVFNHFLSDNRVILMLDGFDELPDYCLDNVIELFECLKYHSNIKQIWITSNSSLVGRLEHCFQMNDSYELQEFEKPAQTAILVEQWKEKYKSCNDEILFNNACKLIQGVKIRNGYYLSFGVPLYLLMLASIFEDKACIKNPSFPETLSLFELYEKYCSKEIFAIEHQAKLGTQEEDEECLFSLSSENFVTWQNDIISPSELLSVIEYSVMSKKKLVVSKLKLIFAVKDNHKFIHYSFREYFLGKFLAYCVEILINNNADLKVIRDVILNMRNKFVLYVFDMSLIINIETCKIFRDVMECNTESINNFTEKDLERYDPLGRGLLYYALHYHCIDALKFLIRKNISLSFEPFFLNFFEQWRSRNDGRHLSYFNHKSIESLDEMVRLNSCYKEIMLYILRKTDKETCPAILRKSVDLSKECELRHWEIINFWINKFDYNFNTLLEFEDFLSKVKKYNCPLETLMIILFKSIDISKLNKIEQLRIRRHASRLVEYKGTDKFLFGCEETLLNRFLKQCLTTKTNVIKLLFDNLIANYVKEVPPFFIEFDKTSLQFSDYIRKIKKRSDNFTIIVKYFLTNGIKVFCYDFQKYKVSLLKRWSNENNNCFQTVKDTSIKDFQRLECPKHFNKEEMYNLMHEYMQEANFDESTTIYEAVTAIVVYILETSGGIKLLNLTYNFQMAVLDRDLPRVAEYFKEAKELGFLEVVSEASYEFGDKIEQLLDDFEEHVHQKVNSIIDEIDGYFS
ncbi:UNVERIFIED_CONTAM: hypothetical protein RMT77_016060 [Armadillidium vulgare]